MYKQQSTYVLYFTCYKQPEEVGPLLGFPSLLRFPPFSASGLHFPGLFLSSNKKCHNSKWLPSQTHATHGGVHIAKLVAVLASRKDAEQYSISFFPTPGWPASIFAFLALHITFQDISQPLFWRRNASVAESGSHGSTGCSFVLFIFLLVSVSESLQKTSMAQAGFEDGNVEESLRLWICTAVSWRKRTAGQNQEKVQQKMQHKRSIMETSGKEQLLSSSLSTAQE